MQAPSSYLRKCPEHSPLLQCRRKQQAGWAADSFHSSIQCNGNLGHRDERQTCLLQLFTINNDTQHCRPAKDHDSVRFYKYKKLWHVYSSVEQMQYEGAGGKRNEATYRAGWRSLGQCTGRSFFHCLHTQQFLKMQVRVEQSAKNNKTSDIWTQLPIQS